MKPTPPFRLIAPLLMALALASSASAATITWTNAAGGDWASATNWSPNAIPGSGDTAVINASGTYAVRVTGSVTVGSLAMANPNATLRLEGNGSGPATLTVANGFGNQGIIELTSADYLYATTTLTVTAGTLTNAAGGVIRAAPGAGGQRTLNANLDNRGTLTVEHDLTLSGNVINDGTVHLADGKTLTVQNTTTWTHRNGGISGTGTLSLPSGSTFVLEEDFTPGTFVLNAPNLTINGPARLLGPATGEFVIRNWTINAETVVSGDLKVLGIVAFNSALAVSPGKTLRLEGNGSGPATLTVANGFGNQGIIELTSADYLYATTTLTVTAGTLTNAAGGVIRAAPGAGGQRTLNANLDNRGTLTVEHDLTLSGNVINDGTVHLADGKTLTVQNTTTWTHRNGGISGTGTLSLPSGSTFVLEEDFTPGTFVLNAPNLTINGPARLLGPATGEFVIRNWTINAETVVSGDLKVLGIVAFNSALAVSPGKTLRLEGNGSGPATLTVANGFGNQGIIELTSADYLYATTTLTVTAGTLTNAAGGVIRAAPGAGGQRTLNANLDNRGTLLVLAGTTLDVNGNLLNRDTGTLGGGGTFNLASATVTNDGTVAPGVSPGILSVTGNLPLNSSALFDVEIGGFTVGTNYDRMVLSSPVSFNGTIRAGLINGFFPKKDDAFTVLTYPSRTGSFTTLDNPLPDRIAWEVQYGVTSAQLVVLNTAPTLAAITNQTVNEQTQLSVTASATDQDLPAQTLTYSLNTAPPGMTINPASGQISWSPTETQGPGNYGVTVRVVDNGTPVLGHTNSFTVTVNEVNVAPQLVLPGAQTVNEQVQLAFTINGTDADLPANALTYELLSGPTGATFNPATRQFLWTPTEAQGPTNVTAIFRVTDNNPAAVNAQQLSATGGVSIAVNEVNVAPQLVLPAPPTVNEQVELVFTVNGTDADLPANALTYALLSGPTGATFNPATREFRWTPTEAQGPTNVTATFRVTDNNPVAVNAQQLSTTGGVSIAVNEVNVAPQLVLPTPPTVNELVELGFTINGTDADLPTNSLTYELLSGPTGATFNPATRQFLWTPTEAQGPTNVTATFRVTDNNPAAVNAQQLSTTGGVSIAVNEVNVAPQLVLPAPPTVNELVELAFTINGTDADLPANALTYALLSGPTGATFNPATREFRWTPTEAQGPTNVTATFRVTDNNPVAVNAQQLSTTGGVSIAVNEVNVAPQLVLPTPPTVNELVELAFTINGTDADLPANSLTYELLSGPTGATFNPATRQFLWTPTEAQGPTNVTATFRVTDNNPVAVNAQQLSTTGGVSIAVNEVNVAPQLVLPAPPTVNEQVQLAFTINGTDADLPANALTYELLSGPTGATFNPATRQFLWTPTEAQGPTNVTATFRVTDNNPIAVNAQQLSTTGGVSIAVNEVNLAPQLVLPASPTVNELVELAFTINGTDADLPTNSLTYELLSGPTGATFNPATRQFLWTPTEAQGPTNVTATFRVTDNNPAAVNAQQLSTTGGVSIAVSEVNLAPVLAAVPDGNIHAGTTFSTTLTATDPDLPVNALTYSLVSGPVGADVTPTGQVNWTAPLATAGTNADFTVRVTDNGVLPMSADRSFQVAVTGALEILGSVLNGEQLEITWRTIPGQTYRLVGSETLPPTGWTPVPGNVVASGATATKTVAIGAAPGNLFLQVELINE